MNLAIITCKNVYEIKKTCLKLDVKNVYNISKKYVLNWTDLLVRIIELVSFQHYTLVYKELSYRV